MNPFARRLRFKALSAKGMSAGEMLARADILVEDLRAEFEALKARKLSEIADLAAALRGGDRLDLPRLEKLHGLVHDLKGQGGTFGYPALSEVGAHFSAFLSYLLADAAAQRRPLHIVTDALDAHVVALTAAGNAARDGVPAGNTKLVQELCELADRFRRSAQA
jgi:hypothetical protein